jgi:hypothetical protein
MMMPSAAAHEKSFMPQELDKEHPKWNAKLMAESLFSHLPIIDCHYNLREAIMGYAWYSRLGIRLYHWLFHVIFFLDRLRHMFTSPSFLWCGLYLLLVWLCIHFNYTMPFQRFITTIFVNILIFPLSFAVNAAYVRREGALALFANFKANCLSLYLTHRCWHLEEEVPADFIDCSRKAVMNLFSEVRGYLTAQTEMEKVVHLRKVYDTLSEVTLLNDIMRICNIPPPLSARLISDVNGIINSFETLRIFSDYRTPSSIRAFINFCIILVPVLLAPFFADLAKTADHPSIAWVAAFLLPMPFLLLTCVQRDLENPFTGGGSFAADSIRLDSLQLMEYMGDFPETPEENSPMQAFGSYGRLPGGLSPPGLSFEEAVDP